MKSTTAVPAGTKRVGLNYWMNSVMREWARARRDFAPEHIHDLRVALRRCRSISDGFVILDPHPAWRQMKSESRKLFRQLGALRDTQVMMDWIRRLAPKTDETRILMDHYLSERESRHKKNAEKALQNFDKKKWASWNRILSERVQRIPPHSLAFQHIALERWSEMRELHHRALRNRSHASYHRLRIGLKKFRYTIESFAPSLYAVWGADLKQLQDLLGEMHDLHVLWQTALVNKAIHSEEARVKWQQRIAQESGQRLDKYRDRMLGKSSLALVWRSGLPDSKKISDALLERLRAWASFRDPDFAHSELVAKFALQIYDELDSAALASAAGLPDAHQILKAAALLHNIGGTKTRKKHHIASSRMIRELDPPLGWNEETLQHVALIIRFHRGTILRPERKAFSGMPDKQREVIILLCGILRLANAFDSLRQKRIQKLELKKADGLLRITAPGYSRTDASVKKLAVARHLLEIACGHPILIE